MKPAALPLVVVSLAMMVSMSAAARVLVDASGETGQQPQSISRVFPVDSGADQSAVAMAATANLSQGSVSLQIVSPDGHEWQNIAGQQFTVGPVQVTTGDGPCELRVTTHGAVGRWQVVLTPQLSRTQLWLQLVGAGGMILVAIFSVAYARRKCKSQWRWFTAGAAMWAVAVILKFAFAVIAYRITMQWMESHLSHGAYLVCGSVYLGLLTGVTEIGIAGLAAWFWPRLARDSGRAIAVGVGAGAVEALLLGIAALVGVVVVMLAVPQAGGAWAAMSIASAATPLAWLAGPVERGLTILCHTSSRAFALLAVARGRWWPFWVGFAILSGVDMIAGWAQISGRLGLFSIWWIELAIAPFAILSIPLIRLASRIWPADSPRELIPSVA